MRKIYDTAFKIKAVELSNERSNITELARELGIRVSMLYKWRKEYEEFGTGSFPGKGTGAAKCFLIPNFNKCIPQTHIKAIFIFKT